MGTHIHIEVEIPMPRDEYWQILYTREFDEFQAPFVSMKGAIEQHYEVDSQNSVGIIIIIIMYMCVCVCLYVYIKILITTMTMMMVRTLCVAVSRCCPRSPSRVHSCGIWARRSSTTLTSR